MAFTKIIGAGISESTNVTVGVITASSGVKGIGTVSYTHLTLPTILRV